MSVTVTKDDLKNLLRNIQAMGRKSVLIGIPESKNNRKENEASNAMIGFLNENGSPARNIPARPFLVPGVKKASDKASEALKSYASDALNNPKAIDQGLNAAGLIAQASVKNQIVSQDGFAPLSPATLAQRARMGAKGTKALIRTGQLLNSITYVVRSDA
jgi:hypothetical protein